MSLFFRSLFLLISLCVRPVQIWATEPIAVAASLMPVVWFALMLVLFLTSDGEPFVLLFSYEL